MAEIDCFVHRGEGWVSEHKANPKPQPGEICINVDDGFGWYGYEISRISKPEEKKVILFDNRVETEKMEAFNARLRALGLPDYFVMKEGAEDAKE